ncbi:hypothetical protein [Pseudomonas chlororaphis]|uniref:hypothetical protein n=1 Tax=Pseudomonas chlororaphis TaxID=587753 RepID=UPI0012686FA2|nr:hypothetical protein [Pseudomonas chlororaphis]
MKHASTQQYRRIKTIQAVHLGRKSKNSFYKNTNIPTTTQVALGDFLELEKLGVGQSRKE